MNVFASGGLGANADSGRAQQGTDVVGLLDAGLGVPRDVVSVGEDSSSQGGTVVASQTNHHQSIAFVRQYTELESTEKGNKTHPVLETAR